METKGEQTDRVSKMGDVSWHEGVKCENLEGNGTEGEGLEVPR